MRQFYKICLFSFVLINACFSINAISQTFSLVNITQNAASYSVTPNCIVTVATAGGGSKAWQGSSVGTIGLGSTGGSGAQNCVNQTGLRLEMSGAGNSSGSAAWNNSITVTVTFPTGVQGPATFSVYDLTEPLYYDGSKYYAYYQDKITILSTKLDGSSVIPSLTSNNGPVSSVISSPALVLTAIRNQGQCLAEPISVGTSSDIIKSITIVYSNQDAPTYITAPVGNPPRYGFSQYQYVFISNITATPYNPLPVELLNFDADCEKNIVNLKWKTASETNNDYFTIERSNDAISWEKIITLEGARNSTQQLSYSATDKKPLDGISYYRLMQTDFDGKSEFFNPVAVKCEKDAANISIEYFPNPATAELGASFKNELQNKATVIIYDLFGRKVLSSDFDKDVLAKKTFTINISHLSKGIYTIEFCSDNLHNISRILKE
jgi:hypothetical protein